MTTYYVDPVSGNNSNAGTSFALAFATTAKAESVVAAGDTVRLCATGTESLTSTNTIALSTNGTVAANITWQGYNNTGTSPLTGTNYYTISGSGMSASTDILSSAGVQYRNINNVAFTASKRNIIGVTGDSGYSVQFNNCSFTAPGTNVVATTSGSNGTGVTFFSCVMTGGGSGGSTVALSSNANRNGCTLIGCTVTAFGTVMFPSGIEGGNGSESYIGNIFANNNIVMGPNIYNAASQVTNNVFYNNTVAMYISDRSSAARFYYITNNTFVNNTTAFLASASNNCFVLEDYNHLNGNGTNYNGAGLVAGAHDISGAPLFNNAGSLDFRLKSGSPLIGNGIAGSNIAGLQQMPSSSGGGTLSVRQQSGTSNQIGAGNGLNVTAFGSALVAGNSVIVAVAYYSAALPYFIDSLGNVYMCVCRLLDGSAVANTGVAIYLCPSVAAGAPTITVKNGSSGASTQYWVLAAIETSPVLPHVIGVGNHATSTTATTDAITTTNANSLVIALTSNGATVAQTISTSGYTQFGSQPLSTTMGLDAEYKIYSSTQTGLTVSWTQ